MNVMLHNMALACKCTDIAPHPVHNDILKLGRAQYNNNEWYQSGPVCLLGVCWNAVCVCVHVCVHVWCHTVSRWTRGGKTASYPTTWSLAIASWLKKHRTILWWTPNPHFPEHKRHPVQAYQTISTCTKPRLCTTCYSTCFYNVCQLITKQCIIVCSIAYHF